MEVSCIDPGSETAKVSCVDGGGLLYKYRV